MPTFDRFGDQLARVRDLVTLSGNATGKTRGGRPVNSTDMRRAAVVLLLALIPAAGSAQTAGDGSGKPRARALGIRFDGTPGALNAITDVPGVTVGHTTLIRGDGALRVGEGPVRTGVTAIMPRGEHPEDPVFAGWFALNGNGEMTGTTWVEESGFLEGPIAITNTHSVGVVRDAIIAWQVERNATFQPWSLPVVAETYDGYLNDINGFHVKPEHVFAALDGAANGAVAEGNVGGGTGMICMGFKGGIGTSSRRLPDRAGGYTIGVLVQANFVGGTSHNGSGDVFIAFSTANVGVASATPTAEATMLSNSRITGVFEATVQATEEAIINAIIAAETMVGRDSHRIEALPHDRLVEIMRR